MWEWRVLYPSGGWTKWNRGRLDLAMMLVDWWSVGWIMESPVSDVIVMRRNLMVAQFRII